MHLYFSFMRYVGYVDWKAWKQVPKVEKEKCETFAGKQLDYLDIDPNSTKTPYFRRLSNKVHS